MKQLLFISMLAIILMSCEKLDEPAVLGTYIHTPEGCGSPSSQGREKFNCTGFLTLSAGGVADILPSGDIVFRTTYKIKGRKIRIEKNDQFSMDLHFKRMEDGSLRNEEDKSIWLKQELNP